MYGKVVSISKRQSKRPRALEYPTREIDDNDIKAYEMLLEIYLDRCNKENYVFISEPYIALNNAVHTIKKLKEQLNGK